MKDFLIIGAGITGAFIARELAKYDVDTVVIEKESDVGNHATLANSALVHSGHDPEANTLKAKLCVEGNAMYPDLAETLEFPLLKSGGLLLAGDDERKALMDKYRNALDNNVPSVRWFERAALLEREPGLASRVAAGLDLPTTMVTFPWEVAIAAMENAIDNGVAFHKNTEVTRIDQESEGFAVHTDRGVFRAEYVINAAGAFAERIAAMAEEEPPFRITPRRGEYMVLDRRNEGLIKHALYPVPSEKGKGVLITPQTHGEILLGPTNTAQESLEAVPTTKQGMERIKTGAGSLLEKIPYEETIRTFAGVRASSSHEDFYIQPSKADERFIHVGGIDSPGLTAAPAIAAYVVDTFIRPRRPLDSNPHFNPKRKTKPLYKTLDDVDKNARFKADGRYGRIICKCERITEGDVVDHIGRTLGATSVKGVKKRARAGSGLCQGGYCEGEIIKVLAREHGTSPLDIDYYEQGTPIFLKETKVKP